MSSGSSITRCLLLPFADTQELQPWHFWLFVGISLAALLGNGLIITSTACDQYLHTPSTGAFAYLKSPSISSPSLDLVLSVLYSVVLPAVNPLIYSLRNQELKDALKKLVTGCV
ncbi:Olfactory receptor 14I1 [Amazona aestiva]|uniref:Olfactory receptor 14I1 n=1 Tax=Amazona aestiva TaxID=12930 RepID=A0A0Q3SMP3_AMAAE|nr:Olfactory receptor 14I1 [Amazona aestiva]